MLFEKKQPEPISDGERAALRADQMDNVPKTDRYDENPFEGKEGVEIRYNLEATEVKKALFLLQKEQIFTRNIIYTVILAVIFVLYLINVITEPYSMGFFMMAVCLGVIFMIWMMAYRSRSAQAKAVTMVDHDFTMTVFDTGILVHQENGDFRALFSEKGFFVRELDDLFLLDLSRQRVYLLPKRCLSDEQVSYLREAFKENFVTGKEKK